MFVRGLLLGLAVTAIGCGSPPAKPAMPKWWSARLHDGNVVLRFENDSDEPVAVNTYPFYYAVFDLSGSLTGDYDKVRNPMPYDLSIIGPGVAIEWNVYAYTNTGQVTLTSPTGLSIHASDRIYSEMKDKKTKTADKYFPDSLLVSAEI